MLATVTFYLFAAVILGSALMVVTRKNAISSALFLALSLIAVAGLYIQLKAEFLFAVQILIYTGGVMVLFLFVIMLVNIDDLQHLRAWTRRAWLPLALVAFSFVALGVFASRAELSERSVPASDIAALGSNTRAVAAELFTSYVLPFEIVSVLLLVAMIGAIVLSRKEA